MWRRILTLAIGVLVVASLQSARPDRVAVAQNPPSVMPSFSVSTTQRTIKVRGKRLIVVTGVTVTRVRRSVKLAIRCKRCRQLRGSKVRYRKTATSRRYTGVNWVLPRGRGISVDATDAGKLGRWTILAPGTANPRKLVFKGSGCLRSLTSRPGGPMRFKRIACPVGTVVPPSDSPVPITPPAPVQPPVVAPPPPPTTTTTPVSPPAPPPPPVDRICCDTVLRGAADARIFSQSGSYELRMQGDGNLVLYYRLATPYRALWSSGTRGSGADRAVMQRDGNLVLYRAGTAVWETNTDGFANATLVMQNDGNVVIYQGGFARWSTGTAGRT